MGGVIAYVNQAKVSQLKVPKEVLDSQGAVSAETAKHMAEGVRAVCGASIGLSVTGIAGPDGGTAEKPIGLVYVGLAMDDWTEVREWRFSGDREAIRESAVVSALELLKDVLYRRRS
jgi:nicotinamide-nucleotide amidase